MSAFPPVGARDWLRYQAQRFGEGAGARLRALPQDLGDLLPRPAPIDLTQRGRGLEQIGSGLGQAEETTGDWATRARDRLGAFAEALPRPAPIDTTQRGRGLEQASALAEALPRPSLPAPGTTGRGLEQAGALGGALRSAFGAIGPTLQAAPGTAFEEQGRRLEQLRQTRLRDVDWGQVATGLAQFPERSAQAPWRLFQQAAGYNPDTGAAEANLPGQAFATAGLLGTAAAPVQTALSIGAGEVARNAGAPEPVAVGAEVLAGLPQAGPDAAAIMAHGSPLLPAAEAWARGGLRGALGLGRRVAGALGGVDGALAQLPYRFGEYRAALGRGFGEAFPELRRLGIGAGRAPLFADRVPALAAADVEANGSAVVSRFRGPLAQGFAVDAYPDAAAVVPGRAGVDQIGAYAAARDALLRDPRNSLSVAYDPAADRSTLRVVTTLANRAEAEGLGRRMNLTGIRDLASGREIPTWGTGEIPDGLPPLARRLEGVTSYDYGVPFSPAERGLATAEEAGGSLTGAPSGPLTGAPGRVGTAPPPAIAQPYTNAPAGSITARVEDLRNRVAAGEAVDAREWGRLPGQPGHIEGGTVDPATGAVTGGRAVRALEGTPVDYETLVARLLPQTRHARWYEGINRLVRETPEVPGLDPDVAARQGEHLQALFSRMAAAVPPELNFEIAGRLDEARGWLMRHGWSPGEDLAPYVDVAERAGGRLPPKAPSARREMPPEDAAEVAVVRAALRATGGSGNPERPLRIEWRGHRADVKDAMSDQDIRAAIQLWREGAITTAGQKLPSYGTNIRTEGTPGLADFFTTNDRWIARAFGYTRADEALGDPRAQELMTAVLGRIAREHPEVRVPNWAQASQWFGEKTGAGIRQSDRALFARFANRGTPAPSVQEMGSPRSVREVNQWLIDRLRRQYADGSIPPLPLRPNEVAGGLLEVRHRQLPGGAYDRPISAAALQAAQAPIYAQAREAAVAFPGRPLADVARALDVDPTTGVSRLVRETLGEQNRAVIERFQRVDGELQPVARVLLPYANQDRAREVAGALAERLGQPVRVLTPDLDPSRPFTHLAIPHPERGYWSLDELRAPRPELGGRAYGDLPDVAVDRTGRYLLAPDDAATRAAWSGAGIDPAAIRGMRYRVEEVGHDANTRPLGRGAADTAGRPDLAERLGGAGAPPTGRGPGSGGPGSGGPGSGGPGSGGPGSGGPGSGGPGSGGPGITPAASGNGAPAPPGALRTDFAGLLRGAAGNPDVTAGDVARGRVGALAGAGYGAYQGYTQQPEDATTQERLRGAAVGALGYGLGGLTLGTTARPLARDLGRVGQAFDAAGRELRAGGAGERLGVIYGPGGEPISRAAAPRERVVRPPTRPVSGVVGPRGEALARMGAAREAPPIGPSPLAAAMAEARDVRRTAAEAEAARRAGAAAPAPPVRPRVFGVPRPTLAEAASAAQSGPLLLPGSLEQNALAGFVRTVQRMAGPELLGGPAEGVADLIGMATAVPEALARASREFGAPSAELARGLTAEAGGLERAQGRLGQVFTAGTRANVSTDRFWTTINEAGARARARVRGLDELDAEEMARRAGDFVGFKGQSSPVAKALTAGRKWVDDPNAHPALRALGLFNMATAGYVRTPERVLGAALSLATDPFTQSARVLQALKEGEGFGAKWQSSPVLREASGRLLLGAALDGAFAGAYVAGQLHGEPPADPAKRKRMEAQGVRWNTLYGIPLRVLGTVGDAASAVATTMDGAQDAIEKGQDPGAILKAGADEAARWSLERSYLRDLVRFGAEVKAGRGVEALAGEAAGLAGRPLGAVTGVAAAFDPYQRETGGVGGQVLSRLPFGRYALPVQRTALGVPIRRGGSVAGRLAGFNEPAVPHDPQTETLANALATVRATDAYQQADPATRARMEAAVRAKVSAAFAPARRAARARPGEDVFANSRTAAALAGAGEGSAPNG